MNNKLAINNYKRFCGLEGNEYIASEFALKILLDIVKKFKVLNVLEIGLGIGSISDTLIKYAETKGINLNYVGTEANKFCLNSLKKNVIEYQKLKIYAEINDIKEAEFDLIIIDGYDENIIRILEFSAENSIIFIEGDRNNQVQIIRQLNSNSLDVRIVTLKKAKSYAHGYSNKGFYSGGGTLVFLNPTIEMKIFWFFHKIRTAMIYKIRKILK